MIEESNGKIGPMRINLDRNYEKSQLHSLGLTPAIIPSNINLEKNYQVTEKEITDFIYELME